MKQNKASLESQFEGALCDVEDTEEMFWLRQSDDYQSKIALGNALSAQYRFREAAQAFEAASYIRNNDPSLYTRLGGAYLTIRKFNSAYDAYMRSLDLGGAEQSVSYPLGVWHYLQEDYAGDRNVILGNRRCTERTFDVDADGRIFRIITQDGEKEPNILVVTVKHTDEAVAKAISDINAIGDVTIASGDTIASARTAYDKLTEEQQVLVTNYSVLVEAEKAYAELVKAVDEKFEKIYKSVGDYIASLGTPSVGSVGGEWIVIGLARSGKEVSDEYYGRFIWKGAETVGGRRKNGAGTIRQRSDGRWEGRIIIAYDDDGKPKYKSAFGKTKTECMEKLKTMQEEITQITGKLPTSAKPDMTFGEWIDLWYQNYSKPSIRESTQLSYENIIYKYIIPRMGKTRLDKLSNSDLQQFYAYLKEDGRIRFTEQFGNGLSDKTVRTCHLLCRMALDKAVKEGLIYMNPAVGCKLPPKKTREMQILTPDEMQRFLIQAKFDGYYEIFLLDIATGMRRGELIALQWDDLNFNTGELQIQRQVYRFRGELKTSAPKTKESSRTIILPKSILKILAEYKKTVNSRWMFPSPVKEDSPRDPKSMYSKIQVVLERSGCKRVRFHDLRHIFATTALEHGMDVKTLSAILGHVSAATTLDIYSHITTEMQRNAAEKIDRGIVGCEPRKEHSDSVPQKNTPQAKFEPYKGKIRKPGTGCIYQINDHLWEGSFTPTHADGKRKKHTVYAKTRDDCEILLADLIKEVKAAIEAEKEQLTLTM